MPGMPLTVRLLVARLMLKLVVCGPATVPSMTLALPRAPMMRSTPAMVSVPKPPAFSITPCDFSVTR